MRNSSSHYAFKDSVLSYVVLYKKASKLHASFLANQMEIDEIHSSNFLKGALWSFLVIKQKLCLHLVYTLCVYP